MADVTLLTITGDRQELFALSERYAQRQTAWGEVDWLVVDDGVEPTQCTLGQTYIRLPHEPVPRQSFRRNLLVGLSSVRSDKVIIWEDDDSYADVWHVERMAAMLKWKRLVGTSLAKYYNVKHRCWKVHQNHQHASLCCTGFSGDKTKRLLMGYVDKDPRPETADGGLWRRCGLSPDEKAIIPCSTVVGIKGASGRGGLGIDHAGTLADYTPDPDLQQLTKWVGSEWAKHYEKYYQPLEVQPSGG